MFNIQYNQNKKVAMIMKILCIGESLLEITCPVNVMINEGMKFNLTEKMENGGGHAGNIAYLLGKWGIETYIASMMGADDFADKIKKEYESIGVKTDYIETSYDKGTSITLSLINQTTKNNTVFVLSNNTPLKKYSFVIEPNIIVSDGNDFSATVAAIDKFPKVDSVLVATKNNNDIVELCRYVKYIIFNKGTAESFTNIKIDYNDSSTLVNTYNKLKQKFSKAEIIVTLGEKGSIYATNGQVKIMPPLSVQIEDTYGAGDAFAGAFIYAICRDFDMEKAVTQGTIAASISTTKLTSRLSIPALTEVASYYDNKFGTPTTSVNNMENPQNNNTVNMNTGNINNVNEQNTTN